MNELTYVTPSRPRRKKGTVAKYRAKRKRADDAVRLEVRAFCVDRDGYCKLAQVGGCGGRSEHAHLGDKRRARTRGQAPDLRHTTEGSAIFCTTHHRAYDRGDLAISMFAELGANGPMRVVYRGRVYMING